MARNGRAGAGPDESATYLIGGDAACDHEATVRVGRDAGMNVYLECRACGGAVVVVSARPPKTRRDDPSGRGPATDREPGGRPDGLRGGDATPLDPCEWIERLGEWFRGGR